MTATRPWWPNTTTSSGGANSMTKALSVPAPTLTRTINGFNRALMLYKGGFGAVYRTFIRSASVGALAVLVMRLIPLKPLAELLIEYGPLVGLFSPEVANFVLPPETRRLTVFICKVGCRLQIEAMVIRGGFTANDASSDLLHGSVNTKHRPAPSPSSPTITMFFAGGRNQPWPRSRWRYVAIREASLDSRESHGAHTLCYRVLFGVVAVHVLAVLALGGAAGPLQSAGPFFSSWGPWEQRGLHVCLVSF